MIGVCFSNSWRLSFRSRFPALASVNDPSFHSHYSAHAKTILLVNCAIHTEVRNHLPFSVNWP